MEHCIYILIFFVSGQWSYKIKITMVKLYRRQNVTFSKKNNTNFNFDLTGNVKNVYTCTLCSDERRPKYPKKS